MTTTEPTTPTPDPATAAALPEAKTVLARRARRTRRAVRTVLGLSHGAAACTGHRPLFDAAENDNPSPAIRLEAAAVCADCPLLLTCGFRVTTRARDLAPSV
ncbi:hypothetical protein ABZ714_26555 [Streptomyces sp. NPDC006798]|uniref:hypothetical protein n=1 Tax=Streptomyces sp. NPDC006798 TaxID=3155462 RepID=UPI00340F7CC7